MTATRLLTITTAWCCTAWLPWAPPRIMVLGHGRQIRHPTRNPEAREEAPAPGRVELRRRRRRERDHDAPQPARRRPPRHPPGHPGRHPRDRPAHVAPGDAAVLARGDRADGRPHPLPPGGRPRDGPRRGAGRHAPVPLGRGGLDGRGRRRREPGPEDVPALPPRRPHLGGRPPRPRRGLGLQVRRAHRGRAGLRPARARHRQPLQPARRDVEGARTRAAPTATIPSGSPGTTSRGSRRRRACPSASRAS